MEKKDFIQFVVQKLKEEFQGAKVNVNESKFSLELVIGEKKEEINLKNIYKEVVTNQNVEYIDTLISLIKKSGDPELSIINYNKERIIPIVRKKQEGEFVVDELTHDLSIIYAIDHNDHLRYIKNSDLNDLFTQEDVKRHGFENAIERRWIDSDAVENSDAGVLKLFRYEDEFLAQFFIPELYTNELGNHFYLVMPTRHIAIAYIPNELHSDGPMEGILKIKELAVKIHGKESYPVSEKVYEIKDGIVEYLG